jgi:hypothetical protein
MNRCEEPIGLEVYKRERWDDTALGRISADVDCSRFWSE